MNQSVCIASNHEFSISDFLTKNMNLEVSEDHNLMSEIANGNQVAMKALINKWKNSLFRFFDRSLSNKADAEDLTQKVFIRIYKSASRYKPTAKFSTYLFTIARNLLIDELKKRKKMQMFKLEDELVQICHEKKDNELHEWKELLDYELRGMNEYHRTALLLRVQKDLSYAEISSIMKVSEKRVKTWIYRARNSLKLSLDKWRN